MVCHPAPKLLVKHCSLHKCIGCCLLLAVNQPELIFQYCHLSHFYLQKIVIHSSRYGALGLQHIAKTNNKHALRYTSTWTFITRSTCLQEQQHCYTTSSVCQAGALHRNEADWLPSASVPKHFTNDTVCGSTGTPCTLLATYVQPAVPDSH